jgi:adenosylhomocysteinase
VLSFTNQVIAQIELHQNTENYPLGCTCCRSTSTRRSPACTSTQLGVKLTKLTEEQADYIGVPVDGPYKPSTTATAH